MPLALRIIASLLCDEPERPLADQVAELGGTRTRLDTLHYDDTDALGRPMAIRATFELSYRSLTELHQKAFRLLAAAPGPDISTEAATILLRESNTRRLLADLARAHLLQNAPGERWSMHDLIRLYADERGLQHADEDERGAALTRLLDHYLTVAQAAATHVNEESGVGQDPSDVFANSDQALAWLEGERANLLAASATATAVRHRAGADLSFALFAFLRSRRYTDDALTVTTTAVGSLQESGDRAKEHMALCNLGAVLADRQQFQDAADAFAAAVAICREIDDPTSEAHALNNLGAALAQVGLYDEAIKALDTAGAIFQEIGNAQSEAQTLCNLGSILVDTGRLDVALRALNTAAVMFRRGGNRHGEVQVLNHMGRALTLMGQHDEAIKAHQHELTICEETSDAAGQGTAWNNLGTSLTRVGRFTEAVKALRTAAAIYTEVGDLYTAGSALNNLGAVLRHLGQFDEAIDAHTAAAATYREARFPGGERTALHNLAVTHNERWRRQKAWRGWTAIQTFRPASYISRT